MQLCLLFCARIFVPSIAISFPSINPQPLRIGIPYLSTHKLRFTSASLAKNQGQCEQDIQHNLGHSNIQQTQHYDSHATTEYNYGMAADIYDKKYNVTKCNQTFEHKKIAPNLDKLKA